jgi:hypothetical protein
MIEGMEIPDGPALLDIARQTLLRDVVPHLQGDTRFKALMVANAIGIAQRAGPGEAEVAAAMAHLPDLAALSRDIRAGRHDGDAAIGKALLALAVARCRISAPKAVT